MRFVCFLALLAAASAASGQIIYEPVQYQYGGQNPYYYGGCDARVHKAAAWPSAPGTPWGRGNGFDFRSGGIDTHREVVTERPQVFTDALPFRNAWVYGFTASDARNQAYARQPRYFRKAELLASARADGRVWIVPACHPHVPPAGSIAIRSQSAGASPARQPRPVLVIPKRLLERDREPASAGNLLTSGR